MKPKVDPLKRLRKLKNCLARQIKKREKSQISKIRNESEDITTTLQK